MTSGVARIWCQWGTTIEAPKAQASTRQRWRVGSGMGREGTPPQPTSGSGGASWTPPAGSEAEPWPLSHFLHVLGHRTLLVARKIRFACPTAERKEKLVFLYEDCKIHFWKWWWLSPLSKMVVTSHHRHIQKLLLCVRHKANDGVVYAIRAWFNYNTALSAVV